MLKNVNRGAEEPSAQVHFTVTGFKESSAIRPHTNDPIWEEAFRFLLHNPEIQDLTVEVCILYQKGELKGLINRWLCGK